MGTFEIHDLGPVTFERVEDEVSPLTLVRFECAGTDVKVDLGKQWYSLGELIHLVCFSELAPSVVVCASVNELPLVVGKENEHRIFHRLPTVGSGMLPVGFPLVPRAFGSVPNVQREEVRAAVDWFLRAHRSFDVYDRTMYLWIALEALVPPVKSSPKCESCDRDLTCPSCGEVPPGYRVNQAIQAYLKGYVDKKTVSRLYAKRSKIVHGSHRADQKVMNELMFDAMRLTQIVIQSINRELGWTDERPSQLLDGHIGLSSHADSRIVLKTEAALKTPPLRIAHSSVLLTQPTQLPVL